VRPPRLRLVDQAAPERAVPEDSSPQIAAAAPRALQLAPVPRDSPAEREHEHDSLDLAPEALEHDSLHLAHEALEHDSLHLEHAPREPSSPDLEHDPHAAREPHTSASHDPLPRFELDGPHLDVPASAAALAELDLLLARPSLADPDCARLIVLAVQVPGRRRDITAALARTASAAAFQALRALPADAPGALEALIRCLSRGLARPVPEDMSSPPPVLALDLRGSRARGFPDLVARAQAIAERSSSAEFTALDIDARRHYRLAFHGDRTTPAALAAQLRAAHLDLAWLHGRLVRLRGTRLWLGGWRFDADDPLGPAAQAHLLQAWLRWAEREPA
jgi:hypothetical protein